MAQLKIQHCRAAYRNEIEIPMARIGGIINSDTLPIFRTFIDKVADAEPRSYILDFKHVSYMNSSGIGELIRLSDSFESFGGTFIITNPSAEVIQLIRLLGLDDMLPILPDPRYAVLLFKKGSFKNATIAIINRRLQEKTGVSQTVPAVPVIEPLGNYTMLLVHHKDFFTKFLEKRLAGNRGTLKIVKNCSQAKKKIKKSVPDMLIIDDAVDRNSALLFDVKSDLRTNRTRVIKMLRPGTTPEKKFWDSNVYIKEDETISEPFDYNELLALARREYIKYKKADKIVSHTTQFEIKSLPAAIETANSMLSQFIGLSGLSADEATSFHLAVKEGIDNAYRHGNRKKESKIIYIGFQMDALKIKVMIRDQGDGFDYSYYLDASKRLSPEQSARERHANGQTGGLGIIMMKKSSDSIEYVPPGNCLTLVKKLRKGGN